MLVLSGPNLDRLGRREPEIYGGRTLAQIHEQVVAAAAARGASVECRHSNHEGTLVDWIGAAGDEGFDGIVLNGGALTHTSYALYDALRGSGIPAVEVHLSNTAAREAFRHVSVTAGACLGLVAGFGPMSYELGLAGLLARLER